MNPFSPITSKIFGGAAITFALIAGVQTVRLSGAHQLIKTRDAQISALNAQHAQAVVEAQAATLQAEATSKDLADATQSERAKAFVAGQRDAAARYADANRVRRPGAPCTVTGSPGVPDPAPDRDGPGENTDLVGLSREDFDTLTDNTTRLLQVQEWSQQVIDAGLAEPQFGKR